MRRKFTILAIILMTGTFAWLQATGSDGVDDRNIAGQVDIARFQARTGVRLTARTPTVTLKMNQATNATVADAALVAKCGLPNVKNGDAVKVTMRALVPPEGQPGRVELTHVASGRTLDLHARVTPDWWVSREK